MTQVIEQEVKKEEEEEELVRMEDSQSEMEDMKEDDELDYESQRLKRIKENNDLLSSLGLSSQTTSFSTPSSSKNSTPRPIKPKLLIKKQKYTPYKAYDDGSRRSGRLASKQSGYIAGAGAGDGDGVGDDSGNGEGRSLGSIIRGRDDQLLELSTSSSSGKPQHQPQPQPQPQVRYYPLPTPLPKSIPSAVKHEHESNSELEDDPAYYSTIQPIPGRMNDGTNRLVFEGRFKGWFEPNVTPLEMLVGGCFGGNYFADTYSSILRAPLNAKEDLSTLPPSYLEAFTSSSSSSSQTLPTTIDAHTTHNPNSLTIDDEDEDNSDSVTPPPTIETHLTNPTRDPSVNKYKVPAGQGLKEWEKSGWIWEGDPRGWFQWYLRFYEGRRCPDDERQVKRWANLAGPSGRFSRSLLKAISNHHGPFPTNPNPTDSQKQYSRGPSLNNPFVEDSSVGTVLRQVCWQWGWEVNEGSWRERLGL